MKKKFVNFIELRRCPFLFKNRQVSKINTLGYESHTHTRDYRVAYFVDLIKYSLMMCRHWKSWITFNNNRKSKNFKCSKF